MKLLIPTAFTDAILTSSTVAENDHAAWNAATSYTAGDRVIRTTTHRIYEAVAGGVDATLPEEDTLETHWIDVGSTNRWRMFDQEVGSQTSGASPLTVVCAPGYSTAIAVLELDASNVAITIKDGPGGATLYTESRDTDGSEILDWFDYFFNERVPRTGIVFTGLAISAGDEVTVTITGTSPKCGSLVIGVAHELGGVQYGASLGIVDYSKKETDAYGNTSILERRYAKRLTAQLQFNKVDMSRVFRLLAQVRATPCVWIPTDEADYEAMTIYGWARNFSIDVPYPTVNYCSLELEGLT